MAFPADGYNATGLTATIRATDGTDEEILIFRMDELANPNTQEAVTAAVNTMADVLAQRRGDGWQVFKTIRYTGSATVEL